VTAAAISLSPFAGHRLRCRQVCGSIASQVYGAVFFSAPSFPLSLCPLYPGFSVASPRPRAVFWQARMNFSFFGTVLLVWEPTGPINHIRAVVHLFRPGPVCLLASLCGFSVLRTDIVFTRPGGGHAAALCLHGARPLRVSFLLKRNPLQGGRSFPPLPRKFPMERDSPPRPFFPSHHLILPPQSLTFVPPCMYQLS